MNIVYYICSVNLFINVIMKNKEIQESRMRGYFIEATKDMIKGEGLKSLSVRSIADRAGYSFATMYNYFRDVNELVFICAQDFFDDLSKFVNENIDQNKAGKEMISQKTKAYISFFTEYPGIFELFFIAKMGELGNKVNTLNVINNSLDVICSAEWSKLIDEGKETKETVALISKSLKVTTIGLLVAYMNRMDPRDYLEFKSNVNEQIERILGI